MSIALNPEFAWVHDSELISVAMDRYANALVLGFTTERGLTFTMHFEEAVEYRIDGVRFQNVIYRFLIYNQESSTEDDEFERLLCWTLDRVGGTGMSAVRDEIRNGTRILFYAEPSIGAEIGVIARAVRVVPGDTGSPEIGASMGGRS